MDENTESILRYLLHEIDQLSSMVEKLNQNQINMGGGTENVKIKEAISKMKLRLSDVMQGFNS